MNPPRPNHEAVRIAFRSSPARMLYIWAQHQADRILSREGESNAPGIPGEVWGIIGEFLAYDEGIFSLVDLNCASREMYQATLPVLYETVNLKNEKAFERAIGSANLKGFKYTKFLFVNDITLPLLRMHQRYQAILAGSSGPLPTDFSDIFPRLVMMAKGKPSPLNMGLGKYHPLSKYPPLYLTLHHPISLPALINVCAPTHYRSDKATSFFGCYAPPAERDEDYRQDQMILSDIVGLTMRSGAYIKCPGTLDLSKYQPSREPTKFFCTIQDEADAPGVVDTLKLVLDHLKGYAGSKRVIIRERWVKLVLRCPPSVLEKYTELFQAAQPLALSIEVYLSGVSTRNVQRHLTALADAYSTHWTHHISDARTTFLKIQANAAAVHRRDLDHRTGDGAFLGPLTEDHCGGYLGELVVGHDDPDPLGGLAGGGPDPMHNHGFTARITETLLFQGIEENDGEIVSERPYRVAHVPIPPADPHPEPWLSTLPAELLGMQLRRNQPRRITPELAARLRVAGHEVPDGGRA